MSSAYGKYWWNTGPNPTYKFGDQWVVSDRLLLDVQYAHVGNNFILGFHSPELRDVQPTLHRLDRPERPVGARQSVYIRPVNSVNVNSNYFMPGMLGGDHAFKFGGYWKDANTTSINHTGGYATRAVPDARSRNDCSLAATGCQAT